MYATASISQSALTHNLSIVKQYAPKTKILAILKANAYGHQLDKVEPIIQGADFLAVSNLSEAIVLRNKTQKPIILLTGVDSAAELKKAIGLNCHIVVHKTSQINLINKSKIAVKVWIKIDTGMHRLGLLREEYQHCIKLFSANSMINIQCLMSHFACADTPKNPLNYQQLQQFESITSPDIKRSMANSAAILSNKNTHFDWVRPGIMLYGVSPFAKKHPALKAGMQLSAPIIAIKNISKNSSVGYGADWIAKKNTKIAIIAIGYADGYPRGAKNGTEVLINEEICALIGRVSMDLICVDISAISAKIGDIAILFGEKLPIENLAKSSNTLSYEVLTGLGGRVKFEAVA